MTLSTGDNRHEWKSIAEFYTQQHHYIIFIVLINDDPEKKKNCHNFPRLWRHNTPKTHFDKNNKKCQFWTPNGHFNVTIRFFSNIGIWRHKQSPKGYFVYISDLMTKWDRKLGVIGIQKIGVAKSLRGKRHPCGQ